VLALAAIPGIASAELKIGVVNAIKILEGAPQAEAARKQLEKEFASRDRDLVARQKSIKEMEDRLSREGATMSEADARKLERDIVSKRRDLKRDQDEFREDVNLRRNEEFGKIQKEIVQSIQDVAKSQGYDLILGEGVIYANEKTDITNAVLDRLRKGGGSP
jgi:outer membrane protein